MCYVIGDDESGDVQHQMKLMRDTAHIAAKHWAVDGKRGFVQMMRNIYLCDSNYNKFTAC